MKEITFTEFRKDASTLFSMVENGELLRITRHGKPIADISPYQAREEKPVSWQKPRAKKHLSGASVAEAILFERES